MKLLSLTKGKIARVSDEDYASLNRYKWTADERRIKGRVFWYARRNERGCKIYMHQEVAASMGIAGTRIDHHDGDGLNNQRDNLRPATHQQNLQNKRKAANCTSRFKGVSWDKRRSTWRAYIVLDYRQKHLGYFTTEEAASAAYARAARRLFKEFACLQ